MSANHAQLANLISYHRHVNVNSAQRTAIRTVNRTAVPLVIVTVADALDAHLVANRTVKTVQVKRHVDAKDVR